MARQKNSPSGQAFVEIATAGVLFSGEFGPAPDHPTTQLVQSLHHCFIQNDLGMVTSTESHFLAKDAPIPICGSAGRLYLRNPYTLGPWIGGAEEEAEEHLHKAGWQYANCARR